MKTLKYMTALVLLLSLAACGGGGGQDLPVNYDFETGDSLPSFSAVLTLPEEITFSQAADEETGAVTYCYENLTDIGGYVADYVDILESMYTCSVIDAEGVLQTEQTVSGSTGDVYVGAESPGDSGILQLQIVWDEASCSVTPAFLAGQEITEPKPEPDAADSLTLDEAIQFFQELSPSQLGLPGSNMSDYEIFAKEGLVMVDEAPCIPVNLYTASEYRFSGSYLISIDGSILYQVDNNSGQVREIPLDTP